VEQLIREAITFHLDGLRQAEEPVPEPTAVGTVPGDVFSYHLTLPSFRCARPALDLVSSSRLDYAVAPSGTGTRPSWATTAMLS
jgi:hypothetical protein